MLDTLARWLPAAALTLVALVQIVLAHTTPLSPWKGGGFGMFSTGDVSRARGWSIAGVTAEGERGLVLLPSSGLGAPPSGFSARLRYFPQERYLRALLTRVGRLRYELDPEGRLIPSDSPDAVPLAAAEVRLWGIQLDLEDGTLRAAPITEALGRGPP